MPTSSLKAILCCSAAAATGLSGAAWAQDAAAPVVTAQVDSKDIVVTARKRQESLLNVPIVETVVPALKLQRLGTTDLKDLTKLAPGLMIGTAPLATGPRISIRGVGTSSSDPGIDQSVSLNIDGLPLGQGLAFTSGLFDLAQVEVLKGPQALFYGKSSPGGVISLHTADPIDRFELIVRGGYEFEAHQRLADFIISGPVTSTIKARFAGEYGATNGFYYNDAVADPGTGARTPRYSRLGRSRDYKLRGTVLWDPVPELSARLKLNLTHDRSINGDLVQLTSCPGGPSAPLGIPFIGGGEDCKKDRTSRVVDMDPAAFPGISNGGTPFLTSRQRYGTLEVNYHPIPNLTATSVTGYYNLKSSSLINTSETTFAGPLLSIENPGFRRRDVTEEVRLNSDFAAPINFTLGGFYQDGKLFDRAVVGGNTAYGLPVTLADGSTTVHIKAYSLFGQLRWKITSQLELAGGARWTDETRTETQFLNGAPFVYPSGVAPRIHSAPISPEVTLTYKPTEDLTLFASYKQGTKSGSFSTGSPPDPTNPDNSFKDEKVKGFEGGIKGRLLDRQLTFSLAGYDYKYTDLQVGAILPTVNGIPPQRTINAGAGRSYGSELEVAYQPYALRGLSLNGSVAWNHARFSTFDNAPCYGGQTIAAGCNEVLNPATGLFVDQNLSGSRFVRAPNWQVGFGFNYELPLGRDMKLILTSSNQFTSKYLANLGFRSDYFQKSFLKSDLSMTLEGPRDRWEIAVIGKNITNRLTTSFANNSNFAGGLAGGQVTGGTVSGLAGIDGVASFMDPGREVWLRLTLRPFN